MISLSFVGDNIGEYYSTEDYYQSKKSGELIGKGVEAFEFDPSQHQHEQFMALVGDRVGVQKKNGDYQQPRKALDMTFSSPKSVSVLYGLALDSGDHALAQKVLDNHTRAVKKAFEHLESEGFFQTLIKFEDGVQKYKATDIVAVAV